MKLNFANVPQFCASINLTEKRPLIDLSELDFIEPSALVYLGVFLRHFNSAEKYFGVKLPKNNKVRKYLADQHFWERFNFAPEMTVQEGRLRTFTSSTSPGDILDIQRSKDIAEHVATEVFRILEFHSHADRIGEIVSELVDNFAVHSRGPLAAFAMQWYPRAKRAVLAIADCGLGIRQTLSRNPKYEALKTRPHFDAAVKAFQPLVTCRTTSGGGTGLTEVRMAADELHGSIRLTTGDGFVEYSPRGARCGYTGFDLAGVQVEVVIPT